jgi:phage terminase small subunit
VAEKKPLTQKQENFCLSYIQNGNAAESYRKCYNTENMKTESVYRKATELMATVTITSRIKELRDKAESKAIITLEQRKELLSKFAWEEESDKAMKAIDLLNKMDSVYVQKQDITTSGTVSIFLPTPDKDK